MDKTNHMSHAGCEEKDDVGKYVQRCCRATTVDLIKNSLLGLQVRRLSFTVSMETFDAILPCYMREMQRVLCQSPSCSQGGHLFGGPGMAGVPPGAGGGRWAFPFETCTSHQVSPNAFALTVIPEVFPLFPRTNFSQRAKDQTYFK